MTLYTKRPNAHLIVSTDCIVAISSRSKNTDSKVGNSMRQRHTFKCGSVMSSAELIAIPRRNVDDCVARGKITCHWQMQIFIKALNGW
jgi:hypothetical protein